MVYEAQHIASIIRAEVSANNNTPIQYLLTDSRKIVFPGSSLFFAISGPRRDGHEYIKEVYARGVRSFVVKKDFITTGFPDALFLKVDNVLASLQALAAFHRNRFTIPVIGITGSNGKTIVKEWLYQLLQKDHRIVRSPRSYNSQIGVPLSVWQMNGQHTLGIFEAGISLPGEMQPLANIIHPTIGVFTNIGEAHSEGFVNNREKAKEKAILFNDASALIFGRENLQPALFPDAGDKSLFRTDILFFSWSREYDASLFIKSEEKQKDHTNITAVYQGKSIGITIPFTDRISIDNAITCWLVMLQMEYAQQIIQERMLLLEPVNMRMQLKKAINNCYLLNDSYSNDLSSLDLALDYLQQQAGSRPTTIILSDILQSGQYEEGLYRDIAAQLSIRGISRMIGIGPSISKYENVFREIDAEMTLSFFASTEDFLHQFTAHQFRDEYILLKGARVFEFERISNWLEQKVHQTVMEINLTAMVHNLKEYQKELKPDTKVMAMVKAFSYGSGSAEVARVLQFHQVDYLAVAYADEGIELRKAGISLPVMVMNADEAGFDALVNYDLEPEMYSFEIYAAFHKYLLQQGIREFPVHLKFNTGMNRLGFEAADAAVLGKTLADHQTMAVKSVFSHLVASESAEQDGFTHFQFTTFAEVCKSMEAQLGYSFIRHIANTGAIHRKPEYQLDMVRLGIGLYGVDSADAQGMHLQTVATLKSTIAQVRKVKAGDTVGYGRKGKLERDSVIATVRIGYADGFGRGLGNGKGKIWLYGQLAPVIGQVCMDMAMIDITDIPNAKAGDEVEIFGKELPVQQVAAWANTIAYEIMTGISQRVKRVYLEE